MVNFRSYDPYILKKLFVLFKARKIDRPQDTSVVIQAWNPSGFRTVAGVLPLVPVQPELYHKTLSQKF